MSRIGICALGVFLTAAGESGAQTPYPVANPSPNFQRAYRAFLKSPATMKEISSSQPGRVHESLTPYSRETFYVEPSSYRERVTPWSFESHEYVPGYGGSLEMPGYAEGYHVPGRYRSFVQPIPYQPGVFRRR